MAVAVEVVVAGIHLDHHLATEAEVEGRVLGGVLVKVGVRLLIVVEQHEREPALEAREVGVEDEARVADHLADREVDVGGQVEAGDELAPPLADPHERDEVVDAHVLLLLEEVEHAVVHQPVDLARHHAHPRQRLPLDVGPIVAADQPRAHEGERHVVEVALQVRLLRLRRVRRRRAPVEGGGAG